MDTTTPSASASSAVVSSASARPEAGAPSLDGALRSAIDASPSPLMTRLGFTAAQTQPYATWKTAVAERLPGNLDDDPALESVVHLSLRVESTETPMQIKAVEVFAFMDSDRGDASVVARDVLDLEQACNTDFQLTLEPVHAEGMVDLVGRWEAVVPCMGRAQFGRSGGAVWSPTRPAAPRIAELAADWDFDRFGPDEKKGPNTVVIEGAAPKTIRLVHGKKTVKRATFDPKRGQYK